VGPLIGEDMVGVIDQTQASLVSASKSAKLVDDTLSVIGAIPFIGQQYQPEVPLSRSITEIAFNLGFMNTSLLEMQAGVQASGRKLDDVRWSVDNLSQQVAAIQPSIIQARVQILEYQLILTTLREKNDAFEKELPAWLNTFYTLATVVLVWVVFSQLGLLLQGWQLLAPAWFRQPEEAHEAPVP
jgi:hypothetical protein